MTINKKTTKSNNKKKTISDYDTVNKVPNYEVSELAFVSKNTKQYDALIAAIQKEEMAPYYLYLKEQDTNMPFDQTIYEQLVQKNSEKIKELKDEITKNEENDEGELEKAYCWVKLGEYYAQIGDVENSLTTFEKASSASISLGGKIDIMLTIVRIALFFNDQVKAQEKLNQADEMIEKGGDWERRNRFKTYKGIHLMAIRNFQEASELLVDSLTAFTSLEIASYEDIAVYASVCGILSLNRNDLKTKIIDSPEVLVAMSTSEPLQAIISLAISLYTSDYSSFFPFLLQTREKVFLPSKFLNPHTDFFLRQMRIKVYSQLLQSYKTLSLKSMADSFGVSIEFLDSDLGKFIPTKQLNCVIDRVNGIIETNRPDNKDAQFNCLIKQSDSLISKLQKYVASVKITSD
ncbi:26S proteasome regulatory subunit RPN7 [Hanseniaspora valbyensis NRRL Y-1626]|uniref:26S proteasome regulatory subunit RPN7 n=1 Tax=Hanseniaspora valbyensis NRRL Y-1626 TaxID=766949 RepID=A0A1B7TG74_9ASCO|nr:26S proteasome regulatory subunit RPN7 [Hanseniaspora valbyensis NRRL Y-1626]